MPVPNRDDEPRRPVPAYLQNKTVNSGGVRDRMGSATSSTRTAAAGSLSERLLTSRAMGKAKEAWKQSSDYIGPRIDRAASSVEAKINRAINDDLHSSWTPPPGYPQVPKGTRVREDARSDSYTSNAAGTSSGGSWWSSVFSGGSSSSDGNQQSNASRNPDGGEDRVLLFNGWSVLRPSIHMGNEPALVIEVQAHGYCYRLKPISQASRTQRAFYGIAKSFAALPSIPQTLRPDDSLDETASTAKVASTAESLARDLKIGEQEEEEQPADIYRNMEKLLELGGQAGDGTLEDDLKMAFSDEPLSMDSDSVLSRSTTDTTSSFGPSRSSTRSTTASDSSILSEPAKVKRQAHAQSPPGAPKRHTNMTAIIMPTGTTSINLDQPHRASTMPNSPPTTGETGSAVPVEGWPKPFAFEESDLPRLHANLQDRLTPFFGQNLPNRKVRLSVYPALEQGRLWEKPLATKVVTTGPRGGFSTVLSIRSKELRHLLEDVGTRRGSLDDILLQTRAELLEQDRMVDALTGGGLTNHVGLRAVAEDESDTAVCNDAGVRVISDIDDTIKWTEVLGGTKSIFRNVFVREEAEIRIPGMSDWYQAMRQAGASFSYVSNSPVQLWPVLRKFLAAAGFPIGSVTLKEYGGASSALAKLWEEPGVRKRAGLEAIITEFAESKFILVGDSGEQDLQVYVSLAQQYPDKIIGIYIRDCTTPFRPNAHPDLSLHLARQRQRSGSPTSMRSKISARSAASSASVAASTRAAPPARSSTLIDEPQRQPPSTTPSRSSSVLYEADADPLSPNNPLRPEPGLSDTQPAVDAFYATIAAAERTLPKHIPLRIFRHGREVHEEGVALVTAHRDA